METLKIVWILLHIFHPQNPAPGEPVMVMEETVGFDTREICEDAGRTLLRIDAMEFPEETDLSEFYCYPEMAGRRVITYMEVPDES